MDMGSLCSPAPGAGTDGGTVNLVLVDAPVNLPGRLAAAARACGLDGSELGIAVLESALADMEAPP